MLSNLKQLNTLTIDMIKRNENIQHHSTNDKKLTFTIIEQLCKEISSV